MTSYKSSIPQKTIDSFSLQNYLNKELVISYSKKDLQTKELIKKGLDIGIRILGVEQESNVNIWHQAVSRSHGDYICIWNPIDLHHPSRLSFQFNSMAGQNYDASILTRIILFDPKTGHSYLSIPHLWITTLLSKKSIFTEIKKNNIDDCTSLVGRLSSAHLLYEIDKNPFLYVYIPHHRIHQFCESPDFSSSKERPLTDKDQNKMFSADFWDF
ncbi:glycosyltransferase family protein [Pedobacter caeni]|nr:hypothetical protein [Pedobacter caeni]